MSASSSKEKWLWLAPLLTLIAIIAGVAALLWSTEGREQTSPTRPSAPEEAGIARTRTQPSREPLDQAPWRIRTFPVAQGPDFDKRARERWKSQRTRVATVVRRVYNLLFLDTHARRSEILADFASGSGRALLASSAGLPSDARRVETVTRKARIGLMAMRPNRAAAKVAIGAKGRRGKRSFRLRHRSTLWLERDGRKWGVIAFEIDQKPAQA